MENKPNLMYMKGQGLCLHLGDSSDRGEKKMPLQCMLPMNWKNQHVVIDEPIEFEK